jgi:hypothetical protein
MLVLYNHTKKAAIEMLVTTLPLKPLIDMHKNILSDLTLKKIDQNAQKDCFNNIIELSK